MKASGAKELFRQLTATFFPDYTVIFANQSRIVKPEIPLVTILPGSVKRPQAANHIVKDGVLIGYYESRLTFTVDLFTNGNTIEDDGGSVLAYENTAMDEILGFADYLNSPKCVAQCAANDVSILIETDAQDLTGLVNDNNYEYRSRLEVLFSFTQETDASLGDMGYFDTAEVEEGDTIA